MSFRTRKAVLIILVPTALGVGLLYARWRRQSSMDAALKSAKLADLPPSATDIMVGIDPRSWFCEVDVSFHDEREAIVAWLTSSPGVRAESLEPALGRRYYQGDSTSNEGVSLVVDYGSGRVDIAVAFEECP